MVKTCEMQIRHDAYRIDDVGKGIVLCCSQPLCVWGGLLQWNNFDASGMMQMVLPKLRRKCKYHKLESN
jgi:hypothetical protein